MALLNARVLLAIALLFASALAGCTDRLSLNSATIEAPSFDLEPREGDASTLFRVDARGLADKHNVTWDWGDGHLSYGAHAEHVYGFTNGVMTVTMLVTSVDGRQGIATQEITLGSGENAAPRLSLSAPRKWVEVGQPANLSARGSDADRDPLRYAWSIAAVDDAGQPRVLDTQESKASVTFDAPGRYVVTARAIDPKGGEANANVTIDVTTTIPSQTFEASFEGTLVAGTGGAGASAAPWGTPAPDTNVDATRHRYTLEYPGSTVLLLMWNDTSGQMLYDLDLELRHAGNGTTIFKNENRAPAAPMEYNFTQQEPGEYEVVIRGVVGADIKYTLLVHSSLRITPEMVAQREA